MTKTRKLIEAVAFLHAFNEGSTIYASEPWTSDSTVIVAPEAESNVSLEAHRLGLKHFLEAFIARQFLEGWTHKLGKILTSEEQCALLIAHAINDA
jgi:hypothetical protein